MRQSDTQRDCLNDCVWLLAAAALVIGSILQMNDKNPLHLLMARLMFGSRAKTLLVHESYTVNKVSQLSFPNTVRSLCLMKLLSLCSFRKRAKNLL